jgi:hypothetical protein
MWHFDMKSNTTERTFNTAAKAFDYVNRNDREAHFMVAVQRYEPLCHDQQQYLM